MRQLDSPEPRSGAITFTDTFEPETDMPYGQVVSLFRALAQNPRTTRFAINALDYRVGMDAAPARSTSSDTEQLARMVGVETYENPLDWEIDVAACPEYQIGGAFHFDGKWTYIKYEDGRFIAQHKKDWADVPAILDEAEAAVTG